MTEAEEDLVRDAGYLMRERQEAIAEPSNWLAWTYDVSSKSTCAS